MALRGKAAWRAARVEVGGRLIAPLSDEYHGLYRTYTYYGCQCERCSETNRTKSREAYHRRRARQQAEPQPQEPLKPPVAPAFTAAEPSPTLAPDHPSEPLPEPQPAPAPKPKPKAKPTPAVDGASPLPSDPIPRFSDSAADHVTSRAHFDLVLEAYYRPAIVMPVRERSDLEARITDGCLIRVRSETGEVVFVGDAERSTAEPESLAPVHTPKRRKHGGSGSRLPTSWNEVRERLCELGCTLDDTHRHTRVTLPNGHKLQLPKTSSDHRAIRNIVSQFADAGINLRRS